MPDYEVFIHHAHVFPEDVYAQGTLERLAELCEFAGIDRAVAFAPIMPPQEDSNALREEPRLAGVAKMGFPPDWLAEALKEYPQFVGFGTIDTNQTNYADQVKRIADLGLLGIKLHPSFQRFDILDETKFPIYEEAQRLGLSITFHAGAHGYILKHDTNAMSFDYLAYLFPELRFIIEHLGHWHFYQQMTGAIYNSNRRVGEVRVYAGFTDVPSQLKPEEMERVIEWVKPEAVIHGLDFPWYDKQRYKDELDIMMALDISEESKAKILGGNLRQLIGLEADSQVSGS